MLPDKMFGLDHIIGHMTENLSGPPLGCRGTACRALGARGRKRHWARHAVPLQVADDMIEAKCSLSVFAWLRRKESGDSCILVSNSHSKHRQIVALPDRLATDPDASRFSASPRNALKLTNMKDMTTRRPIWYESCYSKSATKAPERYAEKPEPAEVLRTAMMDRVGGCGLAARYDTTSF